MRHRSFFCPSLFPRCRPQRRRKEQQEQKRKEHKRRSEKKKKVFFICDITTTRPRAGEFRPWEIFVSPSTCHKDTCLSPPPLNSIPFSLPSACLPCLPLASFLLPRTTSRVSPKGRKQEGTQVERERVVPSNQTATVASGGGGTLLLPRFFPDWKEGNGGGGRGKDL